MSAFGRNYMEIGEDADPNKNWVIKIPDTPNGDLLFHNGTIESLGALRFTFKADGSVEPGKVILPAAFSAYANATMTLTASSVPVKLIFGAEEYDTDNAFASSRFTCKRAGLHVISGGFGLGAAVASAWVDVYKNGAFYKTMFSAPSGNVAGVYGSALVPLAVNDYVELYARQSAAAQAIASPFDTTWFQGYYYRPLPT